MIMKPTGDQEMIVVEVHEVFFNQSFAQNFSEYVLHYLQTSLVPFNLILYPPLFSKLTLRSTSCGPQMECTHRPLPRFFLPAYPDLVTRCWNDRSNTVTSACWQPFPFVIPFAVPREDLILSFPASLRTGL